MKKIIRETTKLCLFIAMILAIPLYAYAAADINWKDEEKREEAWLIYLMTEWENVGDLTFTSDGSYAKTTIDEDFVNDYKTIVIEALSECTKQGQYEPGDYWNLILTMMYYMNDKAISTSDIDIACINEYINRDMTVSSQKESVKLLYKKICECESAYNVANSGNPCDIFQNNDQLRGMIQSVIYHGYNRKYSKKSAQNYYNDSLDDTNAVKYHDFGNDVSSAYKAVKASSNNHVIIG